MLVSILLNTLSLCSSLTVGDHVSLNVNYHSGDDTKYVATTK
jgi:hypothetical protein